MECALPSKCREMIWPTNLQLSTLPKIKLKYKKWYVYIV
jgi:hypothetical protein